MIRHLVNAYDFDHTIYRGDASLDFIIFCLIRHPTSLRFLPRQILMIVLYLLGKKDRKEVKQAAFLFLNIVRDLDKEVHDFWKKYDHKIEPWYLDQRQSSDIIVSASPEFLLQPIASSLGVKNLIGTLMDKNSGKIKGENCRGKEKILRIKKEGLELRFENAYSDTLSDLPLLNLSKHPYIVQKGVIMPLQQHQEKNTLENPKKKLMRELFLYGIIGGSTAALDVILFHILVSIDTPLLVANLLSVSIAIGSSFALNAKYNFKKTDNIARRAGKFFSIGYFGWFIQSIILLVGVGTMGLSETYVKIFAVFVAAAIQYMLNKFLTFRD